MQAKLGMLPSFSINKPMWDKSSKIRKLVDDARGRIKVGTAVDKSMVF
jgi:hypothetical protein